jgi:hypothetical protein
MRSELDRFCDEHNIKIESIYGGNRFPAPFDLMPGSHSWRVTLTRDETVNGDRERRKLSCDFFQGPAHSSEPTPADVLSCLLSDASSVDNCRSFEDWCADLGYDSDSRRVLKIFHACEEMQQRLERFLGCDLYDHAINCEH